MLIILRCIFVLLSICDIVSTKIGVEKKAIEINPIMAWCIQKGFYTVFVPVKLCITFGLLYCVYHIKLALIIMVSIDTLVILNNVYQLHKRVNP